LNERSIFFEIGDRLDRIGESVARGGGVQVSHERVYALGPDGGCVGVIVAGVVVAR
jgi:hypothetical protein